MCCRGITSSRCHRHLVAVTLRRSITRIKVMVLKNIVPAPLSLRTLLLCCRRPSKQPKLISSFNLYRPTHVTDYDCDDHENHREHHEHHERHERHKRHKSYERYDNHNRGSIGSLLLILLLLVCCVSFSSAQACADCNAGEYQSGTIEACACAAWSKCAAGEKQNVAPSLSVNRGCTACDAGRYQTSNAFTGTACAVWSECAVGKKQSVAPSSIVNRVCTYKECVQLRSEYVHLGCGCDSWLQCDICYPIACVPLKAAHSARCSCNEYNNT